MLSKVIVLACLAISSAIAEPQLEHPALAYAAGAHQHLYGGAYSPELYGAARSMSPLQYASSLPYAYAAQLLNQDPFHRTRTIESAPLHYSGQSFPVSYAAGPQAYGGGGAGGVPAYPSLPHHHHAVEYPPPYATASSYHQAAPAIHHTPQYASYAATPVQHAAPLPPSVLGGYTSAAPAGHPHHPSALAAASGVPSFLSAAAGGHPLAAYAAAHAAGALQHHPGGPSAAAAYLQALDAAGGMGAGAGGRHYPEHYGGTRGGPLSYSGQMAQGAASAEAAHRMAAQLSALIAAQGSMGEARAQARSDSE